MSDRDPTLPRRDVVEAWKEGPRLYVAAKASLGKGTVPGAGNGAGRWAPPIPINAGVHDLIAVAEWQVLQLNGRLRLALGYSQRGRLHDACPFCGLWSLAWYAADGRDGVIRCDNTDCSTPDGRRSVWRGRAGWLELAALLAASDTAVDPDKPTSPQPQHQESA
jgi:hypothetical protein